MSSYVESAYSIERRRLLGILNQCQKELDDAISAITCKKQERESVNKQFQDYKKTGFLKQDESRYADKIQKNSEYIDLLSQCDFLEKKYATLIDETTEEQILEIRDHLLKEDVQPKLMFIIIERLKDRLEKKLQLKSVNYENYSSRNTIINRPVLTGQRGVMLGGTGKKEKRALVKHKIREEFEQKLQIAKQTISSGDERVLEIERNYISQPEFAKELYAEKMLAWINVFLEEEQDKTQKITENNAKVSDLMNRYEALLSLLGVDDREKDSTLVKDTTGSFYKSLEIRCKELENKLLEKKKREYVTSAIQHVMKKHGIDYCGIDEKKSKTYTYRYDDCVDFSISGLSQNRFVTEMNGKYFGKVPTLDEKRKSVSSAKKACGFLRKIREELAKEYGIIFEDVDLMEPTEKTMHMLSVGNDSENGAVYELGKREKMTFSE